MAHQLDAVNRDTQLGPKVVDIKRCARALGFAVPALVTAGICEPFFEKTPTTNALYVLGPKMLRG
jgi:hypothetical protein